MLNSYLFFGMAYLISVAVVKYALHPVQEHYLPWLGLASLLYLPHAIRILAAWFLGWRSVPVLFAASLIGLVQFYGMTAWPAVLIAAASSSLCAIVSMRLVTAAVPPQKDGIGSRKTWRLFILAGFIAALLNSVGQSLALLASGDQLSLNEPRDLLRILAYATGDFFGLIAVLFVLMLAFRWQRGLRAGKE